MADTRHRLNQSSFARAVGITRQAAHRLCNSHPILRSFSVEQAVQWYRVNVNARREAPVADEQVVQDAMAGLNPVQKATVLVKTRQAAKLDRQIRLLDEFYVSRDLVRSDMRALLAQFRTVVLNKAKTISDLAVSTGIGNDANQRELEDLAYGQLEEALNSLARQALEIAERPTNRRT